MSTIWKVIPGYDYEASGDGEVRRIGASRSLRQAVVRGYAKVTLFASGVGRQLPVHRLVLMAFVGEPADGQQGNHIDGVKLNNRIANLEWCTPSENSLHAFRMGLRVSPRAGSPGERNGRAVLTGADVREIRQRFTSGESQRLLARVFGVSKATIQGVTSGRRWRSAS